ncbi:PA0069 family radical SAM protein [Parvularcula lutaonensis]|uniref:PA0069 family radical SAM protein n=1 Tax=Parvularcula lutaonensis TaxID=491923 RepID=A0ABV7M9D3_9PROT|nr:PA0069 family radical SAM protein [Parvularcula lutaonensis]GGY42087.1 radical SAM protein [Parvularcula lutaonensis]
MGHPAHLNFKPTQASKKRGRGAFSNASGRYESEVREAADDGWEADEPLPLKTEVVQEAAKKIVTFNDSPFVGFDRSINPYRGCEHGCVYCFARPTHAYMGLSPGLDFESKLFVKPGAPQLLRKELSARRYRVRPIAIGTNTDPYQPIERRHEIMRQVLEVLLAFRHPVSILTKSHLILRDLDVLQEMQKHDLVRAMISITTLDGALARTMEPRAPTPKNRLAAVKALADAGIPTGTVHGPMIPGLSDHELERLMQASREAGATFTAYTLLRLPQEVGPIFEEWLESAAPTRKAKVLNRIREINGGRVYDVARSRGGGPKGAYAEMLDMRFRAAKKRYGFTEMPVPSSEHFRVPGSGPPQPDLFG